MKARNTVSVLTFSIVIFIAAVSSYGAGAFNTWLGADGNWFSASNWDGAQVPAYADVTFSVVEVLGGSSGPIIQASESGSFSKMQIGTTTTGQGTMTVDAGGSLLGKWYILVGDAAGTNGLFNNSGSVTLDDWVGVGRTGTGVFNNSGSLTTKNDLTIGTNASGNGTFTSSGTVAVGKNLIVGQSGTGVFNMNGGTMTVAGTVSLPGSVGSGTFNINSGTVNVVAANGFNIGGASGILNMNDGLLNVTGRLNMWNAGAKFNLIGGTAKFGNILDSTFVNYGNIDITGGQLLLAGDLTASTTLLGYLNNNKIYTSIEGNTIGLSLVDFGGSTYTALNSIPEPATITLLGLGLLAIMKRRTN